MELGQTLSSMVSLSEKLQQVQKMHVRPGDFLLVRTCNSTYAIRASGDDWFEIAGGWFDRKGKSPMRVRINGCTWGGSVINISIVAACGLCLEFGNRVVTSPVQRILMFPYGTLN